MRVQGQSVALEKKQNKAKTMVLNWCQEEHACTLCLASTGSIPIWKWQFEVRGLNNKAAELGKNSTISPLVTKIYHNLCPNKAKAFSSSNLLRKSRSQRKCFSNLRRHDLLGHWATLFCKQLMCFHKPSKYSLVNFCFWMYNGWFFFNTSYPISQT